MKYLGYIFAFLIALSAFLGFSLLGEKKEETNIALQINDKKIDVNRFNKLFELRSNHIKEKSEFVDTLITKELLIQEAQRENINREESFRLAIQNFYEQSLIKTLIERKFSDVVIKVDPKRVDRYLEYIDKEVKLEIFAFPMKGVKKGTFQEGEEINSLFQNLSTELRIALLPLMKGKISDPVAIGNQFYLMRLMEVEENKKTTNSSKVDRKKINSILRKYKKEEEISQWIEELKRKASIQISSNVNH